MRWFPPPYGYKDRDKPPLTPPIERLIDAGKSMRRLKQEYDKAYEAYKNRKTKRTESNLDKAKRDYEQAKRLYEYARNKYYEERGR